MIAYLFKVYGLANLFYLLQSLLLLISYNIFLLLELLFELNKSWFYVGSNAGHVLLLDLLELLFLFLFSLQWYLHSLFRLLSPHCRFHLFSWLFKLSWDFFLSFRFLIDKFYLQLSVLKPESPKLVFLSHLFELPLALFYSVSTVLLLRAFCLNCLRLLVCCLSQGVFLHRRLNRGQQLWAQCFVVWCKQSLVEYLWVTLVGWNTTLRSSSYPYWWLNWLKVSQLARSFLRLKLSLLSIDVQNFDFALITGRSLPLRGLVH